MDRVKEFFAAVRCRFASLTKRDTLLLVLVFVCLVSWIVLLCILTDGCGHNPQPVTQETQTEAETPAGVEHAAEQARVPVSPNQAQTAAKEIRYIYQHDTKPVYTITTTADKAQARSETARKAAGADFSIVTDKSNPTAKKDLTQLPKGSTVELNQDNVQAYKQELHTVEVAPDLDSGKGVSEVGYTVQRKITKDGKYIGFGAAYNVDNHKTLAKVTYTW